MKKTTKCSSCPATIRKVKLPYNYLRKYTDITITPDKHILVINDTTIKDIDLLIRLGLNIPYVKENFRSGNKSLKLKNNLRYLFIVNIINGTITIN